MFNFLISFAKVCFRNGEFLIDFIKEVSDEVKKSSPESKELSDMEEQLLDSEEV